MNPLTQVKNQQKITAREAAAGVSEDASWHAKYKDSAYVYIGGLPFDLTEGDVLAVFAQYGEIMDLNLIRDKATGKPKGFAYLAYADQRSTILAVDNLNGARVLGRIIRVDHKSDYKRKKPEDEEEEQRKREERGVCHAFQRGECNRGDACKFSHDEKRNENTGWGKDEEQRWKHDWFQTGNSRDQDRTTREGPKSRYQDRRPQDQKPREDYKSRDGDERAQEKRPRDDHKSREDHKFRDQAGRAQEQRPRDDYKFRDQDGRSQELRPRDDYKSRGQNGRSQEQSSRDDYKSRDRERGPRDDHCRPK